MSRWYSRSSTSSIERTGAAVSLERDSDLLWAAAALDFAGPFAVDRILCQQQRRQRKYTDPENAKLQLHERLLPRIDFHSCA